MHQEIIVSVVTPTYNRCEKLGELFDSLVKQQDYRFEWLIMDDGSTDDTENAVKRFMDNALFDVVYHRKPNHGKHTALNASHKYIRGKYVVIVDSDDRLVETAIGDIISLWDQYGADPDVVGITFQRKNAKGKVLDDSIKGEYVSSFSRQFRTGFKVDHCETFRTDAFIKHEFPCFDDEVFLAEGPTWYLLSKGKKTVYSEKAIYICEYLENGLTRNVRRMMVNNPKGAYWNALQMINRDFSFMVRYKNTILALCYSMFFEKGLHGAIKDIKRPVLVFCSIVPALFFRAKWGGLVAAGGKHGV